MSIATVVTGGYGNGTFNGTIAFVVTGGYSISAAIETIRGEGNISLKSGHNGSIFARASHNGQLTTDRGHNGNVFIS